MVVESFTYVDLLWTSETQETPLGWSSNAIQLHRTRMHCQYEHYKYKMNMLPNATLEVSYTKYVLMLIAKCS